MEKGTQQVDVGNDFEGNLIQGNYNNSTFIKNEIDGEEFGKSLGEALANSSHRDRWEEHHHATVGEDSRQIMETVFVSLVIGLVIGACWHIAFPWNVETVPFFVTGTIVLFNVLRITHFGLRRSFFKVGLVTIAFSFILGKTAFIPSLMGTSQFAGSAVLSTLGAIIGLLVGFIQFFWHPLED